MRRIIFPVLLGIVGVAILCSLGIWQVQRLAWKEGILAEIGARIAAAPVELPSSPTQESDPYLPVTLTGTLTGEELHVLTSHERPGYRVIAVVETTGRRVMADLGFVPQEDKDVDRAAPLVTLRGNLHWPQEVDRWTPAPDPANIWFARDVPAMAAALDAEPFLIVVAEMDADIGVTPLPIDTAAIKNDHREYAITWFLLALVWAVMSGFLVVRTWRASRKE